MERLGKRRWKLVCSPRRRSLRSDGDGWLQETSDVFRLLAVALSRRKKNISTNFRAASRRQRLGFLDADSGLSSRNQKTTFQTRKDEAKPAKLRPVAPYW